MTLSVGSRVAGGLALLAWVAIGALGPAVAAHPPLYEFGEIVVTGERTRVVDEVTTVDVVTAEEIERSGARTVDEAVALLPGLYIRRGAEGVRLIDVRGLRTRNVLVLLDGVPLNSSFDGLLDPATLPVESIAHIKVTRGASSMLYGPGGNGGVLNIVTRAAGEVGDASVLVEGRSWESLNLRGRASLRRGDLGLVFAGSLYDRDSFELSDDFEPTGLEDGGRRLNSDRRDESAFASSTLNLSDDTRLGVNVNYRSGERGKPPVTEDFRRSEFAPRARFERVDYESISLHAALSHDVGRGTTLRPALYFDRSTEHTEGFDDGTFSTQRAPGAFREEATTRTVGGALQLAVRRDRRGLATVALDLREESWEAAGFVVARTPGGGPSPSPIRHDRSVSISSIAAEYELTPKGSFAAVVGAGYATQRREGVATDDGLSLLLGATYALGTRSSLRGTVARKIRFPTLRDLYAADRGNPELDAERTLDYEVAIERENRTEDLHLELVVFGIEADDFIRGLPGGILSNLQKTRFRGIEVAARHRLPGETRLHWSYTRLDAENRSSDADVETLQNQPEHKVAVTVERELSTGLRLRGSALYVADNFALSRTRPTRVMELGDYGVLDLSFSQPLSADRLRLTGRLTNLLDEDYSESIGFPSPGRTLFVGIELALETGRDQSSP
jgi:outer membrane cobalamin receptor